MKKKDVFKAAYGAGGTLEALVTLVRCSGASAADVMYYLTRILGIALPLPVALAVRAAILASSGHCLIDSIKKISPELYRRIKRQGA